MEARRKCKKAEYQSDLVSDEDIIKSRKSRSKKVFSSDEDEDSAEDQAMLPDPPQRKKSLHTSKYSSPFFFMSVIHFL